MSGQLVKTKVLGLEFGRVLTLPVLGVLRSSERASVCERKVVTLSIGVMSKRVCVLARARAPPSSKKVKVWVTPFYTVRSGVKACFGFLSHIDGRALQ